MNRYKKTFARLAGQNRKAFVPFMVLGDPNPKKSLQIIDTLIENGADILELGFPFSDPIADGPVIQAADTRAINAGVNTDVCFRLIAQIRKKHREIPIGLLLYYNLILARGIDKFYADARLSGVDSILIADLPVEESQTVLKAAKRNGIRQVFIVSELTQPDRLKKITASSSGFLYIANYVGTTGNKRGFSAGLKKLIAGLRRMTKLPLLLGFGISTRSDIKRARTLNIDGTIIGSALVKAIGKPKLAIISQIAKIRPY